MKRMKKFLVMVLTLALLITMIPFSKTDIYAAKQMKLNKKKVTLQVGKSIKLKVKNKAKGVKVKWKSKKKKVAKVTKKGKVIAKKAGKTTIIAKVGTKKFKCKVVVKKKGKTPVGPIVSPTTQAQTTAGGSVVTTTQQPTQVQPTEANVTTKVEPTQRPTQQQPTTTQQQPTQRPTQQQPTTTKKNEDATTKAPSGGDYGFDPSTLTYTTLECNGTAGLSIDYSLQSADIEGIVPWYGDGGNTFMLQFADPQGEGSSADITVNGGQPGNGTVVERAAGLVKINPNTLQDNAYSVIKVTLASGKKAVFVIKKGSAVNNPTTRPGGDATTRQDNPTNPGEQNTTQGGSSGSIYDGVDFLGDGAKGGELSNTYKAVIESGDINEIVNIQEMEGVVGIYITMKDADLGVIQVNGSNKDEKTQGAGIWIDVNDLTQSDNTVVIKNSSGGTKGVLRVYNAKAGGGQTTTKSWDNPTQATTKGNDNPTQATTNQGSTNIYDGVDFLGDGARGGELNNRFKAVVTSGEAYVNNIQEKDGVVAIHTILSDANIGTVTVNGFAKNEITEGAGLFININDLTQSDNEVVVKNPDGSNKVVIRVYNANPSGGSGEQPITSNHTDDPTTTPQPTTTKNGQITTTKAQTNFNTDPSIEKPFGINVTNPDDGIIRVVWGAGDPNCYNVYVDGVRRRTKVNAASYDLPVQTEGRHIVSIAHVNPYANTESERVDTAIDVRGTAPEETTAIAEEDMPQIDTSVQKQDGKIVLQLNNKTNGKYRDDQIYWIIVGRDFNTPNHVISYIDVNGNLIHASLSDNDGDINGRKYSRKIVHTLADNKEVQLPTIESGRMYISYGEPVYITFNGEEGNIGYAGPDTNNKGDANYHTLFEYLEFTTEGVNGGITFHGNTTRVDFFSFPMVARLTDEYGGYDRCVGDVGTRDEIYAAYRNEVSDKFDTLITDERIMCPAKLTFGEGQQYGNYYDDYINRFWSKYTNEDLVTSSEAGAFRGRVQGNRLVMSDGNGTYYVDKPSTQDVFEGRGAFNRISAENRNNANGIRCELAIEAQLCAAFTRGLAMDPSKWWTPSAYYKSGEIFNEYAAFFHRHSVGGRAYGFCYDDVNDQSTLIECGNAARFTIDLKW